MKKDKTLPTKKKEKKLVKYQLTMILYEKKIVKTKYQALMDEKGIWISKNGCWIYQGNKQAKILENRL